MGLLSRMKKMFVKECVEEQEQCVLLKYTTNDTAENHHPHRPDEAPVVAGDIDGGRKNGERDKKKKSFWKWPALRFPRQKAAKYDLAEAEKKYQSESGAYQTSTD
ncbi:hypothetical protein M9458_023155, partial [Cirrhinus mrigala]